MDHGRHAFHDDVVDPALVFDDGQIDGGGHEADAAPRPQPLDGCRTPGLSFEHLFEYLLH